MNYFTFNETNYNLHIIKTNKFKNVIVKASFKNEFKKEDIVKNNMIGNIISDSSFKFNTHRKMAIKKEELYNIRISAKPHSYGNSNTLSISANFLNEKYSEKNIFESAYEFLSELIFNPNVISDKFDSSSFNLAKNYLNTEIDLLEENPNYVALKKTFMILDNKNPLSFPQYGEKDDLNSLDEKELFNYYRDTILSSELDIFVIGDVDVASVKDIVRKYTAQKTSTLNSPSTKYNWSEVDIKESIIYEPSKFKQSKLVSVLKLDDITEYEKNCVLPIYSLILGGSPVSKLFQNVREKQSLCYNISSTFIPEFNTGVIRAGIDSSNSLFVNELIIKSFGDMGNNIPAEIFQSSKDTMLNDLKGYPDSIYMILHDYINHVYLGSYLFSKLATEINKVELNDVFKLHQKIKFLNTFVLKGANDENK